MSLLRQKLTRQPQWAAQIDWSNPLTKGLAALFCGGDGFDLVNRIQFTKSGAPTREALACGVTIKSNNSGNPYDGFYAPELAQNSRSDKLYDPVAPPITLFIVGNGKSGVNTGSGLIRGNGSGPPSFGVYFWDGSFNGASLAVRTTGGQIYSPTPGGQISTASGTHVAVLSIGPTTTTLYCDKTQKDTYSTPSGNFYYEYSDEQRVLSVGGSYACAGGNIGLAGMIVGKAWSDRDAFDFIANPWQLIKAPPQIPFAFSASAPQLLAPTGQLAGSSWIASSGGTLYSCVDESSADDADYTYTTTSGAWEEFTFDNGGAVSVSGGHVRYRVLAGSGVITVELRQGSTVLQTWGPHTMTGGAQDFDQTITASTSDSNDLRVRFTAS